MTTETRFPILIDHVVDNEPGSLSVKVTDEGIICDVVDSTGEVIATWGATAQEMADEFCR